MDQERQDGAAEAGLGLHIIVKKCEGSSLATRRPPNTRIMNPKVANCSMVD